MDMRYLNESVGVIFFVSPLDATPEYLYIYICISKWSSQGRGSREAFTGLSLLTTFLSHSLSSIPFFFAGWRRIEPSTLRCRWSRYCIHRATQVLMADQLPSGFLNDFFFVLVSQNACSPTP